MTAVTPGREELQWSCDERNRKQCRNGHGCHCREITDLLHRLAAKPADDTPAAYRWRYNVDDREIRWTLRSTEVSGDSVVCEPLYLRAKPADEAQRRLDRANKIIAWMMPYIGTMCPPQNGLGELNDHCFENGIRPNFDEETKGRPINQSGILPNPAALSTTGQPKLDPPDNSLTDPSTMGEVE